jgi:hypothetical protein
VNPREVSPRDVFIGGPAARSGREAVYLLQRFGIASHIHSDNLKTCKGSVLSLHSR